MAISKVKSASIVTDAVGPTQLNEAANYDFTGTVTGAGGVNTPAFQARLTSNQSVSSSTQTTVAFNVVTGSEAFDSDSAFNTTTYKFVVPSGEGGKYFITSTLRIDEAIPSDRCAVDIEVNGVSAGVTGEIQGAHQFFTVSANAIFILNASDTVESKFFQDSGSSKTIRSDASLFAGYKIIE